MKGTGNEGIKSVMSFCKTVFSAVLLSTCSVLASQS